MILDFLKPIARRTPTSFVYSNKLADMLAERAKKQRHIVVNIIILKDLFIMLVTLSKVETDSSSLLEPESGSERLFLSTNSA